jgi:Nif-specific regulatory protein
MAPRRTDLELEALYEIGKLLALTPDPNKAFTTSLIILSELLGLENGTLSLFDPVTGEIFIEAAPQMRDEQRILGRLQPGEGIIGRIFATGMPAIVPDIGEEPLFLNRTGSWRNLREDPRAFLGVPLRDGRTVLGVVTADRRHADAPYSLDRDLRVLTAVSHLVSARIRLMQLENTHRRNALDVPPLAAEPNPFPGILGGSQRLREVMGLAARAARSRATILIRGESGTGKELFARAIHEASPRSERPFVALNCAAIPESLLESELFGHERGAFTGASALHAGRFEQADGGTLFLDEIGELSPAAQAKLLRVIQERQFERVGGRKTITVDVRLLAATHRDLEQMVREGQFRLDLYHRLSVVTLLLPPLRDRPEDIPPLAAHFLRELADENGRAMDLLPDGLAVLTECRLTGNVRQLRNCLERAFVGAEGPVLGRRDFPCAAEGHAACLLERLGAPAPPAPGQAPTTGAPSGPTAAPASAPTPSHLPAATPAPTSATPAALPATATERERLVAALERCGWVQAKAARFLGMTERQLGYRVRKHGIRLERL